MSVLFKHIALLPVPIRSLGRSRGHTKPAAPVIDIFQPGRLRVAHLMALFGLSHSTLYARIRSKQFPKADGHDGRIPFWNTATIRALLDPIGGKKA